MCHAGLVHVLQKATQDARSLSGMTRERDRLLQELAAATQKLTAAAVRAADQDTAAAQNATQLQQVHQEPLVVCVNWSSVVCSVCILRMLFAAPGDCSPGVRHGLQHSERYREPPYPTREPCLQMEERLRQANLQLKGAQQEVALLRVNASDVAAIRREVAMLEQELNQVPTWSSQ